MREGVLLGEVRCAGWQADPPCKSVMVKKEGADLEATECVDRYISKCVSAGPPCVAWNAWTER